MTDVSAANAALKTPSVLDGVRWRPGDVPVFQDAAASAVVWALAWKRAVSCPAGCLGGSGGGSRGATSCQPAESRQNRGPVLAGCTGISQNTHTPTHTQVKDGPVCLLSVQSAVIKVFQGAALQANELYTLNESIR